MAANNMNVARVIGATGNSENASIAIKVQLTDGSEGQIIMDGPTAQAMLPTVHQAVLKLADLIRRGPIQSGQLQVQVLDIQTAQAGYDPSTKSVVLLFDQGKISQTAWRMSERTTKTLVLGLAKVMQDLSDSPPPDKPH